MDTVEIYYYDEVYVRVCASDAISRELYEYFSFYVPGYKFMPAYKNKLWNGQIKLFDLTKKIIYFGLLQYIIKFCKDRSYDIIIDKQIQYEDDVTDDELTEFIDSLDLTVKPRDYQIASVAHCIRRHRALLLSPTASGKSLIIYLILRWFNLKTLIIVPTVSLTKQLFTDFQEYCPSWNASNHCHIIVQGQEKETEKQIVISTWQSIFKMPKKYFKDFDLIIGDEAHLFKAKSLTGILTKLISTKNKIGTTGTIDDSATHRYVLEGLFGPVFNVVSTKKLIDNKHLADIEIKALILTYHENVCQSIKNFTYQQEMDFLVNNEKRNKFIRNLVLDQKGNTLLLFQFVEKHGKILYDMLHEKINNSRKLFFVSGATNADTREDVRRITELESNAIIVASFGTFSTGINIKNLHNIVFASPSKSKIRNLQSIGRGLRKSDAKTKAIIFDIADNLQYKQRENYTIQHFRERIKQYSEQQFEFKIYNIPI